MDLDKACSIKELIHKGVRKEYDATGDTIHEVKNKLKKEKLYAVGFNGEQFCGIKLTANKYTKPLQGLKIWTAVMDNKTCESCQSMNNQTVPIHEPFVFQSSGKTYRINEPPLHGFNLVGSKRTTYAIPGMEENHIQRFEEPTCRCMALFISQVADEDKHYESFGVEIEYEPEIEAVDRFLLEAVIPIDTIYNENGPESIPDETYTKIAEHFEDNYSQVIKLAKKMKKNGPIKTLKEEKYI